MPEQLCLGGHACSRHLPVGCKVQHTSALESMFGYRKNALNGYWVRGSGNGIQVLPHSPQAIITRRHRSLSFHSERQQAQRTVQWHNGGMSCPTTCLPLVQVSWEGTGTAHHPQPPLQRHTQAGSRHGESHCHLFLSPSSWLSNIHILQVQESHAQKAGVHSRQ